MAKAAGIATSALARYEQGGILDPHPWILEKIATILQVPPLNLIPPQIKPENSDFWGYFGPSGTLGGKIKQYRLSRHIQQKELAKMLRVDRESIRRYEKGLTKPEEYILKRIEDIMGSSLG